MCPDKVDIIPKRSPCPAPIFILIILLPNIYVVPVCQGQEMVDGGSDIRWTRLIHRQPRQSLTFFQQLQNKRDPEARTVSISTAFNPVTHPTGLDLIFSSLDCVLFYVDMKVIAKASPRAFQSAISASSTHEPPGVMNIILIQETSPTFETLVDAVNHMPLYDISPAAHIIPSSHIYATLVAYAPLYPLELYGLAGQHQIHELAVATSSHLLSYPLPSMSDEIAQRMGALYLKRLFDLHRQ